tara:strand:- start:302 stop:1198 length:897 start_codon:yes stop_codon:yes gene_type:complete
MTQQNTKIELDIEAMRKIKLFIATPMYGGMCYGLYTKSLMDTTSAWLTHGMQHEIYYLFNESLVTRARNYCVANFLESEATHLMFIDSDVSWKYMDLMYMTHLMATREDIRVFCGLYPKKTIAWEKVLEAAKSGLYDEHPVHLEKVAGDMVFNPDPEAYPDGRAPLMEPIKIKEGATGFMMIERSVFEEYGKAHPELWYTPDHIREGEFSPDRQICAYFDCKINHQNRYLSEDYMFSENCRELGIDIWALPMIELMHSGSYIYQGRLMDMAHVGVHATMDPEHAKKIIEGRTDKSIEK